MANSMFKSTIAGSLPKPSWLAEPEKLWAPWRLENAELERGKQDAALVWMSEQEAAGIDIIANGEQFREHFVHGFLKQIEGIDWNKITTMGIRNARIAGGIRPTGDQPVSSELFHRIIRVDRRDLGDLGGRNGPGTATSAS